jgi:hypothetical protein
LSDAGKNNQSVHAARIHQLLSTQNKKPKYKTIQVENNTKPQQAVIK